MKFYLYDKDTKEYQGEQLGYIDPLETELFDKDTCQQLSLVMLQAVQALYAEYWGLKNRLAACETIAEVEAITWPEAGK